MDTLQFICYGEKFSLLSIEVSSISPVMTATMMNRVIEWIENVACVEVAYPEPACVSSVDITWGTSEHIQIRMRLPKVDWFMSHRSKSYFKCAFPPLYRWSLRGRSTRLRNRCLCYVQNEITSTSLFWSYRMPWKSYPLALSEGPYHSWNDHPHEISKVQTRFWCALVASQMNWWWTKLGKEVTGPRIRIISQRNNDTSQNEAVYHLEAAGCECSGYEKISLTRTRWKCLWIATNTEVSPSCSVYLLIQWGIVHAVHTYVSLSGPHHWHHWTNSNQPNGPFIPDCELSIESRSYRCG